MKTALRLTLGFLAISALLVMSAPAHAATAAGPYDAWPAWDQTLQCDTGPTLPAGHPFTNVQSSLYWSATFSAGGASAAEAARLASGGVGASGKSSGLFVWCARGGQGVDPQ
jgi:hypothetical protein